MGKLEPTNDHVSGFIVQLVRASHRYREVTGSGSIEVFFRLLYAIAKIASITARIIALLDFISTVQYMMNCIYHFVHIILCLTTSFT